MVTFSRHALRRMRERGITRREVEETISHPLEVRGTRYGRRVACRESATDSYVVVVFEADGVDLIVVTALKVDRNRLERYGFTRV